MIPPVRRRATAGGRLPLSAVVAATALVCSGCWGSPSRPGARLLDGTDPVTRADAADTAQQGEHHVNRRELIDLVERIQNVTVDSEDEHDALITQLLDNVVDPRVTDHIFGTRHGEMTAEEIVDRALAYRPIAL